MQNENLYLNMLNKVYFYGTNNHPEHNSNPDYYDVLLRDLKEHRDKFFDKSALDFGCGKGRNVTNMLNLCDWKNVDGIDLSQNNIDYCILNKNKKSSFFKNDGLTLKELKDESYDFVMSTIVFQHICVKNIRYNLKKEIFRILKPNGIFSFQMGFGDLSFKKDAEISLYEDNNFYVSNSNGTFDVRVTDPQQLINDLSSIGFKNISYVIKPSWADGGHKEWIYCRAEKC